MLPAADPNSSEIERIINEANKKLNKVDAAQVGEFITQYYRRMAADDLATHNLIDLAGAALAHWHLARQRTTGTPKVHAYNPAFEKHGWQSTHTIIEIVTDDRPFLVDSVSMALNRSDSSLHLTLHPVMQVVRDASGQLKTICRPGKPHKDAMPESFMRLEIDRQTEPEALESIEATVRRVLDEVGRTCDDWQLMRDKALEIVHDLETRAQQFPEDDRAEAAAFFRWIEANHFTFLGYCEFDLDRSGNRAELALTEGSQLGILRKRTHPFSILPTEPTHYSDMHDLLVVTKASGRSTVHRPAYMDFIGIKRFDAKGRITGERCLVGLFTSAAYNRNTREIPLLRRKVKQVLEQTGLTPSGHGAKALQNIIEVYPRDNLFQISTGDLYDVTTGILALQERQRIRLFIRPDRYRRFYLCLVYLPRERYSRELRLSIQDVLTEALAGTSVEYETLFSESVLARILFTVYTDDAPAPDVKAIEYRIIEVARSWQDDLRNALAERYGEERGNRYCRKYGESFPISYQADFAARSAAHDIWHLEQLNEGGELDINFYRPLVETAGGVRLKLFSAGRAVTLSDVLPMIENMGLKAIGERSYEINPRRSDAVWIHEFNLVSARATQIDPDAIGENFQQAFLKVWKGEVENDAFNQLVVVGGLNWSEIVVLRACCRYLKQILIPYSVAYIIETLSHNPHMSRRLVRLFNQRFDPALQDKSASPVSQTLAEINTGLDRVANLDEDRILRSYLELIQGMVRTNFFQRAADGTPRPYVSFKFDSRQISGVPEPKPMFEIFVYSPQVEAVHLRGGKVARGGLRWSDRREDFRTEVLGLVKAQMVKNAVIVPVGSKGGFVVKRPPANGDRAALLAEGIECYKTFIRGMLDITDNLKDNTVAPPADVVRYDDDDPYLVVAADKGTATFSDIANGVAEEYGYWLGDAFASGGSSGYDHKGMGITARGAWESVKRHFRELGFDTQNQDFTVIGIGDMAGDVFGNGMLLSAHIRLLGAFNHLHIFVDPNPDAKTSFAERERLFRLPRSGWPDYDTTLISTGGGVFRRSAKSISLSPQIRAALRISAEHLTPNELIHAMLQAPVDLLWNGGIGTYVKAASETHARVSDRANDVLRVNGKELRCKVVGEGGNLGITQLGRIEYSRAGGLCYTDAIDNSAGVDTSDHEVNIKILLNRVVANGDMTTKQRDRLLADMTDEVGELVLHDNYRQTQAISASAAQADDLLAEHARYLRTLEREGKLDRQIEFLPNNEQLDERQAAGEGLRRPELAVLLAYSKIDLYHRLLSSDVPEDAFLHHVLEYYFPDRLAQKYLGEMSQHRLKREIIATYITNSMVNRAGPTFAYRLGEITGASPPDIARAYTAARQIFSMPEAWASIEALDNKVASDIQLQMLNFTSTLVERATLWLLRERRSPLDVAQTVDFFEDGVQALFAAMPRPLAAENRLRLKRRTKQMVSAAVPGDLAARIATFIPMSSALDIVEVAHAAGREVDFVATLYFDVGGRLHLMWLRDQVTSLATDNHWHMLAQSSLQAEYHAAQRAITAQAISLKGGGKPRAMVARWVATNGANYDRYLQLMGELQAAKSMDFAMLSVALSAVQTLVRS